MKDACKLREDFPSIIPQQLYFEVQTRLKCKILRTLQGTVHNSKREYSSMDSNLSNKEAITTTTITTATAVELIMLKTMKKNE